MYPLEKQWIQSQGVHPEGGLYGPLLKKCMTFKKIQDPPPWRNFLDLRKYKDQIFSQP